MRKIFVVLATGTLAACGSPTHVTAQSAAVTTTATTDPTSASLFTGNQIVLGGRWQSGGGGMQTNWAGASIQTRAMGQSVVLHVTSPSAASYKQTLDVFVDGTLQPSDAVVLAAGTSSYTYALPDATAAHAIVWRLRTEANYSTAPLTFAGIDAGASSQLMPTAAPSGRGIEFIGDSITNGYGVLGSANTTCAADGSDEDATSSFGALVAVKLSADYRLIASSGRGAFRNRDTVANSPPDQTPTTVAQIYDAVLHPYISNPPVASSGELATAGTYSPDSDYWTPQVVVINLGTNDFSRRTDSADNNTAIPDEGGFVLAYEGIIADVFAKYPNAVVVPCLGPMLSDAMSIGTMVSGSFVATPGASSDTTTQPLSHARSYINEAITSAQASSPTQIIAPLVEFSPQDTTTSGCDAHPSAAEQQAMATQLASAISTAVGW